jgi:hypothetical protein
VYSTLLFSPCYSNLLLRRRGWTGILRRGVLGYVLPRLSFLWCYVVFCYSVPLRVVIVFRDTIYVIIIILYSWYLDFCEHFWPYVWNNWSWVIHTMSTWFWCKNQVWQSPSREPSPHRSGYPTDSSHQRHWKKEEDPHLLTGKKTIRAKHERLGSARLIRRDLKATKLDMWRLQK